jgi:hypothetical protein
MASKAVAIRFMTDLDNWVGGACDIHQFVLAVDFQVTARVILR